MLEKYDDILSIEELCEVLKIGRNAAYAMLDNGTIAAFRNGRNWRIPKTSVIAFIECVNSGECKVISNKKTSSKTNKKSTKK